MLLCVWCTRYTCVPTHHIRLNTHAPFTHTCAHARTNAHAHTGSEVEFSGKADTDPKLGATVVLKDGLVVIISEMPRWEDSVRGETVEGTDNPSPIQNVTLPAVRIPYGVIPTTPRPASSRPVFDTHRSGRSVGKAEYGGRRRRSLFCSGGVQLEKGPTRTTHHATHTPDLSPDA